MGDLPLNADANDIVNLAAWAVVAAQANGDLGHGVDLVIPE